MTRRLPISLAATRPKPPVANPQKRLAATAPAVAPRRRSSARWTPLPRAPRFFWSVAKTRHFFTSPGARANGYFLLPPAGGLGLTWLREGRRLRLIRLKPSWPTFGG